MKKTLSISTYVNSQDTQMFIEIINQGIDARLTGFTKSTYYWDDNRLYMEFDPSELEILLRRLSELENPSYSLSVTDLWEYDIIAACYNVEIDI